MKRLLLMLMAVVCLLTFCGCSALSDFESDPQSLLGAYKGEEEKGQVLPARSYISMIYYEDMDTNPLTTANRENHELLKLVYSPLIRLTETLKAEYILAETITAEGLTVQVTLKKDLKFSDGSALTAQDVVYSYQTVMKNYASPYASRLVNLKKVAAADGQTVVFTLHSADTDFVNCLDLPIIGKNSTAASGAYCFSEKNGKLVLIPNPHYHLQSGVSTIYLQHPANERERQNMFSVGLLDVYFTSAESETVFSGGKDYQVQTYASDHLLYLGVNCVHPLLGNSGVRGFLNRLLEREKLASSVLLGQAEATAYPFQPAWYKAEGLIHEKNLSDLQKKEQAAALGLNLTENALLDGAGAQVTFSLLAVADSTVHQDTARAVADSFALSGIKINIEAVSRADYQLRLQSGQYELYLGEMKTGRTLNPVLYTAGSTVNFSGAAFPELETAAAQYKAGALELSAFAQTFDASTPFMPLVYRRGVLFVSKDIGTFQSAAAWSIYGDITKLITKETEISA